ncbi:MAG: hypothetical protein ACI9AT_000439 [Ulvibacter sp.]|jgi:hypothetical protein
MITQEEKDQMYKDWSAEMDAIKANWDQAKNDLKGLIHPKYFDFAEDNESFASEGIVKIVLTDEKKSGYPNYPCCRVLGELGFLYMSHSDALETIEEESKYEEESINYYVWQTVGYSGDDYSGYLLLPMNDGRYWKVSYSC